MPTDLVLLPLADAFHEVGLPVAVLVALFGWARLRHGDRLTGWLLRHAGLGPAVGALLGVVPGCGAEIVLVTLLMKRAVSYDSTLLVTRLMIGTTRLYARQPAAAIGPPPPNPVIFVAATARSGRFKGAEPTRCL